MIMLIFATTSVLLVSASALIDLPPRPETAGRSCLTSPLPRLPCLFLGFKLAHQRRKKLAWEMEGEKRRLTSVHAANDVLGSASDSRGLARIHTEASYKRLCGRGVMPRMAHAIFNNTNEPLPPGGCRPLSVQASISLFLHHRKGYLPFSSHPEEDNIWQFFSAQFLVLLLILFLPRTPCRNIARRRISPSRADVIDSQDGGKSQCKR